MLALGGERWRIEEETAAMLRIKWGREVEVEIGASWSVKHEVRLKVKSKRSWTKGKEAGSKPKVCAIFTGVRN